MSWLQTFSGKRIEVPNFNIEEITIEDIAHALSMKVRFNGHVKRFWSVAQHSILVSKYCDPKDALFGLLHDASEAYMADIPSPLKRTGYFDKYRELELVLQSAIFKKFCGSEEQPQSVHVADLRALVTEARQLLGSVKDWQMEHLEPFDVELKEQAMSEVENEFLQRFEELND